MFLDRIQVFIKILPLLSLAAILYSIFYTFGFSFGIGFNLHEFYNFEDHLLQSVRFFVGLFFLFLVMLISVGSFYSFMPNINEESPKISKFKDKIYNNRYLILYIIFPVFILGSISYSIFVDNIIFSAIAICLLVFIFLIRSYHKNDLNEKNIFAHVSMILALVSMILMWLVGLDYGVRFMKYQKISYKLHVEYFSEYPICSSKILHLQDYIVSFSPINSSIEVYPRSAIQKISNAGEDCEPEVR